MNMPATHSENLTLSLTRDFDAPREKVFQAWTDPQILTRWMGPQDVDTTVAEVDLRVGGRYRFVMQGTDGTQYSPSGEYREIDPPSKLVFTWAWEGETCAGSQGGPAETLVTLTFEDRDGKTRLTLTQDFLPSEASREAHHEGWTSSFDCLEAALA